MAGEGAKLEGGRVFEWEGVIEIGVTPSGEDQVLEMHKGREGSRQKAKKQCIGERPTWLSMHMDGERWTKDDKWGRFSSRTVWRKSSWEFLLVELKMW
jgi:hypothetical protein